MIKLLLFIISLNCFAQTTPTNSVQAGGAINSSSPAFTLALDTNYLSSIRTLSWSVSSDVNNAFYNLNYWGTGGGQYQVAANKNLYCNSFEAWTSYASTKVIFGYATVTFSNGTTSAPTGTVYFAVSGSQGMALSNGTTASTWAQYLIPMTFPSGSYPFVKCTNCGADADNLILECVEM